MSWSKIQSAIGTVVISVFLAGEAARADPAPTPSGAPEQRHPDAERPPQSSAAPTETPPEAPHATPTPVPAAQDPGSPFPPPVTPFSTPAPPARPEPTATPTPTCGPMAAIISPTGGKGTENPEVINLDGSASTSGYPIMTYFWAFDDGTSDSGSSIAKSFVEGGAHSATLTIVDESSCTASAEVTFSTCASGNQEEDEDEGDAPEDNPSALRSVFSDELPEDDEGAKLVFFAPAPFFPEWEKVELTDIVLYHNKGDQITRKGKEIKVEQECSAEQYCGDVPLSENEVKVGAYASAGEFSNAGDVRGFKKIRAKADAYCKGKYKRFRYAHFKIQSPDSPAPYIHEAGKVASCDDDGLARHTITAEIICRKAPQCFL